jgi:hypothetical protein
MSASNEWSEYHLTPGGWVEGSEKLDFNRSERPAPVDRVLTVRQHDYLSSSFSKLDQWSSIEWHHQDHTLVASLTA